MIYKDMILKCFRLKTVSYRPIVWTWVSYLEHTEGSGEGKLTKLSARFHTKPSSLPDASSWQIVRCKMAIYLQKETKYMFHTQNKWSSRHVRHMHAYTRLTRIDYTTWLFLVIHVYTISMLWVSIISSCLYTFLFALELTRTARA